MKHKYEKIRLHGGPYDGDTRKLKMGCFTTAQIKDCIETILLYKAGIYRYEVAKSKEPKTLDGFFSGTAG